MIKQNQPTRLERVFSWALRTLYWGPVKSLIYSWNLLDSLSFYLTRYKGRWFNSNRQAGGRCQVETFASRKSSLGFFLYLLIWFLPTLLGLDPNGTFVWCDGRRFTPIYALLALFRLPSIGLIRNYVKLRTPGTVRYAIPLNTSFPQPLQPLPFTYESDTPRITLALHFFRTPGGVRTPYWILQPLPLQKKPIQYQAEI